MFLITICTSATSIKGTTEICQVSVIDYHAIGHVCVSLFLCVCVCVCVCVCMCDSLMISVGSNALQK